MKGLPAVAAAFLIAGPGIADPQLTLAQQYQKMITNDVTVTEDSTLAFSCGLRSYEWVRSVAESNITAAEDAANLTWPGSPGHLSDEAEKQYQAALKELTAASDAYAHPTPEQCTQLASSGNLAPLDDTARMMSGP